MKENKNGWLDLFRRGVLFINRDLLWMVVWQAGAWLLACLVMAVFSFFVKEDVLGILDVPGICALTVGTLFFFFEAINFFGGQYSLLVGFGLSRRRTVALGWFLCILMGVVELAVVGVLNTLWRLVLATPGQFAEILALVPLWGWAVLLLLPLSLAVMGMAVIRLFGPRGGAALYFLFLCVCFSPNALRNNGGYWSAEQVFAVMPWIFLVMGVVCALLGTILLLRAPLRNG